MIYEIGLMKRLLLIAEMKSSEIGKRKKITQEIKSLKIAIFSQR